MGGGCTAVIYFIKKYSINSVDWIQIVYECSSRIRGWPELYKFWLGDRGWPELYINKFWLGDRGWPELYINKFWLGDNLDRLVTDAHSRGLTYVYLNFEL